MKTIPGKDLTVEVHDSRPLRGFRRHPRVPTFVFTNSRSELKAFLLGFCIFSDENLDTNSNFI